jgi:hypothetical protein
MRVTRLLPLLPALALAVGCNLNTGSLFVRGEPFIISGTAAVRDQHGPCPVWIGENGVTYQLFQGARLDNDEYDRILVPGVTSRLEIATRNDLVAKCDLGTIVEVQRILEVVE